jgi:predicted GNAT family acetyltransferase
MTQERFVVEERPDETRYVLIDREASDGVPAIIGQEAYVDVPTTGGPSERVFFHTEVSENYAGQGLGGVLVRAAVEAAIAGGCSIVPVCPYVAAWLRKHPEYAAHVVHPSARHLRAVNGIEES